LLGKGEGNQKFLLVKKGNHKKEENASEGPGMGVRCKKGKKEYILLT